MRLLICAGGTGGGVYPALSVLKQLMSSHPETTPANTSSAPALQVLWVGGEGGMEADLVKREGLRFESIPAAGVHGVGMAALLGNLWRLGKGFLSSRRILRKFRPDVLFYTGGYVAVPMAFASRLPKRSKSLLYVPDIEPGLALKTIARFSDCVTLTVDESREFFQNHPSKVVTGYPLRPGLEKWTIGEAQNFFALDDRLPTLLVLGGSRGARSINQAIVGSLPKLLDSMQVIHISGKLDWPIVEKSRSNLTTQQLNRYRPFPYLYDEIGAAMTFADLVVSRAGASTLGELPIFGLPAILVPYPYAWRYQRVNASYLIKHGAALQVDDAQLQGELATKICEIMADQEKLAEMSEAMHSLAKPDAAAKIANLLKDLATPVKINGSTYVPNPTD